MSREPIRIRSSFNNLRCHKLCYGILVDVSIGYLPDTGKLLTRYAPFRRSPPRIAPCAAPRLACVKPVASVHPEPGSNSPLFILFLFFSLSFRQPDQQPRIVPASALFLLLTEGFRPLPSSCLFIASFQCSLSFCSRFVSRLRVQR